MGALESELNTLGAADLVTVIVQEGEATHEQALSSGTAGTTG